MGNIKYPFLLLGKSSPCLAAAGFLSHCLNGPVPYGRRHITVNKILLQVIDHWTSGYCVGITVPAETQINELICVSERALC